MFQVRARQQTAMNVLEQSNDFHGASNDFCIDNQCVAPHRQAHAKFWSMKQWQSFFQSCIHSLLHIGTHDLYTAFTW